MKQSMNGQECATRRMLFIFHYFNSRHKDSMMKRKEIMKRRKKHLDSKANKNWY